MKKYILGVLLIMPIFTFGQFSESLLNKIRYATDDYYISRDTLSITGSRTLPCLDIFVNGKGPFRFLIDLGSNVLNFKKSLIEGAEIEIIIDREDGADLAVARKVKIGESIFLDVHGAVYEDLGQDLDGVLGFNLLGKADFFMDYPNLKFAFISEPEKVSSSFIPYELIGRMPYLRSKIEEKEFLINFDTGAAGWLYFPTSLKDSLNLKAPIKQGKKSWNNQTGTTNSYIGELSGSINFGEYIIKQPGIIFLPDIEDIFVGSSLLQDFKLTFYVNKKLVEMQSSRSDREINIPININEK